MSLAEETPDKVLLQRGFETTPPPSLFALRSEPQNDGLRHTARGTSSPLGQGVATGARRPASCLVSTLTDTQPCPFVDVLCSAYFLLHWQILCPGKPIIFTRPFIEKVCQPLVCVIGAPGVVGAQPTW